MESFVNRALSYLGLKDIDDEDDLYVDDYEPEFDSNHQSNHRGGHTAYPEHEPESVDSRMHTGTIRPITGEDLRGDSANARAAVVRPLIPNRATAAEVHVVAPSRFSDAQEIGDVVRRSNPVIVNLQMSERDLARRMIDFCSGLTYALDGQMRKVADQVFLLTPSNVDLPPEERQRLQERGLFRS